ncbi:MAG: hypothetical protein RIS70_1442 [Planctomycetota bacterium]
MAGFVALAAWTGSPLHAKPPTVEDALQKISPVQTDISYDRPDADAVSKCKLESINQEGVTGFAVRSESGQLLRRFLDTNKDSKLDVWCYYRDGVEIYRDIDSNFNGRTDQYRWLGTAGTRWGIDENEDGTIDSWKSISAEEVTAEVVAALRNRDAQRFQRLLLTTDELTDLGLGETRTKDLRDRLEAAREHFGDLAGKQKLIGSKTEWTNFGATQPGIFPAGTDGSTRDLIVYENVAAMIDNDGKSTPLPIGTLVQVGSTWRIFDLPNLDAQAASVPGGNFFVQAAPKTDSAATSDPTVSADLQKLIDQLSALDGQQAQTPAEEMQAFYEKRAALLEKLYAGSNGEEERNSWLRQLADSIGAAVQTGDYSAGVERLQKLVSDLTEAKASTQQIAYVAFRCVMAEHDLAIQDEKADYSKLQTTLEEKLSKLVSDYADAKGIAEVMMHLANVYEYAGKNDEALDMYNRIVKEQADSDVAKKAAGAQFRLELVGKSLPLKGKILDGKANNTAFDLAQMKGKVVLVHYWATWCQRCTEDMTKLKELQAKYAKQGLTIVGVNLDSDAKTAGTFLQANKLPWNNLFEQGGMDGRLAVEMGIVNLPTMILVDKDGKVVANEIHAVQLENELAKIFKEGVGNARNTAPKSTNKKSTK